MFEDLIREVALHLLASGAREVDPARRRQIAESYWDLVYLYRHGLPKIPDSDLLPRGFPRGPQPDPSPIDRLQVQEELLFGLVALAGDPEPEPNVSGLTRVLGDKAGRLSAAKGLAARMGVAAKHLAEEIARLEGRQ